MTEHASPHEALIVLPFLDGPRTTVVVAGALDAVNASSLLGQLARTVGCGTRSLVVDLTDLATCDPQGVEALTRSVEVVVARGVAVSLRGQSPHVADLLSACGGWGAPRPA